MNTDVSQSRGELGESSSIISHTTTSHVHEATKNSTPLRGFWPPSQHTSGPWGVSGASSFNRSDVTRARDSFPSCVFSSPSRPTFPETSRPSQHTPGAWGVSGESSSNRSAVAGARDSFPSDVFSSPSRPTFPETANPFHHTSGAWGVSGESSSNRRLSLPETSSTHSPEWGSARNANADTGKHIPWTNEEIAYMRNLNRRVHPNTTNRIALFLSIIREDTSAWPIFHRVHVKNSDSLRTGFRTHIN